LRALLRCRCYAQALQLSRNPTTVYGAPVTPRLGWGQWRKAGDNNNGQAVVNILVTNVVHGMIVDCGDGVGRGVCGGKGGRNRAGLVDEARGWSAAGTNSRLATLKCCCVIIVILARAMSSIQRRNHTWQFRRVLDTRTVEKE
jgi:hypothetical protein